MEFTMTVGPKGQVVIPKQFRDELSLLPGQQVLISNANKQLTIKRKSEQIEKIMAEITEFAHKYGRKDLKIDMNEEFEKETDELIEEWKLKKYKHI